MEGRKLYHLFYTKGSEMLSVHAVLEDLAVPYRAVELSAVSAGQAGSQHTKTEVLVIGTAADGAPQVLTETPAILLYLARSRPEAELIPSHSHGEALCFEWLNWLSTHLSKTVFDQVLHPDRFILDSSQHREVVTRAWWKIEAGFEHVETRLSDKRQWAIGADYSIADVYLLVFWLWGGRIGLDMTRRWPVWAELSEKTIYRPAVRRAMLLEGLD